MKYNEKDGRYYDAKGTAHTVSEACKKLYTRKTLKEMLAVRSAAYRATEAGTLSPAKRDAIERAIGAARKDLMPEPQFSAALKVFRREIETAKDKCEPTPPHGAANIWGE